MKILIIPNNVINNCFGVRNALPKKYLEKLGHEVRLQQEFTSYIHPKYGRVVDPTEIDWAEVVVFNRHYEVDDNTILNIMRYAKQQGKLVIYETDDLLERLDPSNPMYESIKKHVSQVQMMAREASACTTTVPELRFELRHHNNNVFILPNCVDQDVWQLRRGGNKRLRVGWAGGSSHAADVEIIVEVVKRLKQELDFEFVIFGLANEPWHEHVDNLKKRHTEQINQFKDAKPAGWYTATVKLAEQLDGLEFEHHPFVKHEEYNQKLADMNLDIGLCPLVDTVFNRCKSAIKFYEYAMVGTVCLASKIPPYEDEVMYCAKNRFKDWYSKLRRLIIDEQFRLELQQKQRAWVLAHRDIEKQVVNWERVYRGESADNF